MYPRPLFQTCTMVFFASLAVLAFEVALVRLCSIRYSYHYATVIISISMVGFVLGGIFSFLRQKPLLNLRFPDPLTPRTLLPFLTALVVSMPLVAAAPALVPFDHYRLLWENGQLLYLMVLACVLAVPFLVYGTMMSLLFKAASDLAGRIYAADLGGAAAGVLGAVLLADSFSPERVIVILSAFPAAAVAVGARRKAFVCFGLCLYLLGAYWATSLGRLSVPMSPYASLQQALKEEGSRLIETIHTASSRVDLFENRRMRFAPGLSLNYRKPVPKGLGVAVDGNISGVILDEASLPSYDFFNYMPAAAPYLLVSSPRVVISGNKGGIETLMARYFGARSIAWTDKDLSINRLVHERYDKRGPYGESFRYESMREYLQTGRLVDLIVISRTVFLPSGAFGLQEDYETTVEALEACLSSLAPGGLLYIQLFILPPPRYELRMTNNLARALERMGTADVGACLLVFRSWDTLNFLVRKSGFTTADRAVVEEFLEDRGFARVWPAPASPAAIQGIDYADLVGHMINREGAARLEKSSTFDIRITTDDRPFFHYYLKVKRIGEVYRLAGRKWAYFVYEGMALPFLAGLLFAVSCVVFAGVLLFSRLTGKTALRSGRPSSYPVARPFRRAARYLFFGLIGVGFMFVEVFFIHALILPLGSSTRAFAFALVALLLGAVQGA